MLGSISPVGEMARRQRWWITATAYTVASVFAGALTGAALGGVGQFLTNAVSLPNVARLSLLAAVVIVAVMFDTRVVRAPLPTWHRQVDERWLTTYRGWVYGAGFGLQLGSGVVTIVPSAVTYAMLAAALLTGTWQGGLIVGVVFGVVRSLPVLLTVRLRTPAALYAVTARVTAAEPVAHQITVGGQITVALIATVAAVMLLG